MTWRKGDWRVQCERTGKKCWASETVVEWTGLIVHRDHVDYRSPQEFVRGVPDKQIVPNPNPEGDDVFLSVGEVTADDL